MAAFLLPTPPSSSSPLTIPRRHTPPLSSPRALSSTSIPPTPPPAASPSSQPKAVIIGAGLAGLAAAVHLHTAKIPFVLLDSSDAVGGRVRTDLVDGFLLDRGFQILLTAYPESSRLLHYPSLQLRPFYPGSLVFHSSGFHLLSDPFRHPLDALPSLLPSHPIGSILDKLLVLYSRLLLSALPPRALLSSPKESSILHRLRSFGFSDSIIDRFFRPFFAGVFFDPDLATSSRLFDFVFHCLSLGDNALPSAGIGALPLQLASRLPPDSIRLRTEAASVSPGSFPGVSLSTGETIPAALGVIVAVDQPQAERIVPGAFDPNRKKNPPRSTDCIYFSADRPAIREPMLILNGSGEGIVNNMCFISNVAPSYAPAGKALVSVSLVGSHPERSDEDLAAEVVRELGGWFGPAEVAPWRHLRTYRIRFAQPDQTPPTVLVDREPRVGDGVYMCGDHWSSATFDGALVSGRKAAEALITDRSLTRVI